MTVPPGLASARSFVYPAPRASLAGERRRAGFSVPDNAYPAGVNPSW
jgi:hypothetical protein